MKKPFLFVLFLVFFQNLVAQNFTGKVIDSQTGESIPYATIIANQSENLVSNAEGYFTLSEKSSNDVTVLTVSYLGFESKTITVEEVKKLQNIIRLNPGIIALNEVRVSDKKLTPYEIMANVKANFKNNYGANNVAKKDLVFFRTSSSFKPLKLDVEIEESTGFNKQALQKANNQLSAFTSKLITQPPREYTDILCHKFSFLTKKNDKPYYLNKLKVLKATKLKNENSSTSLEELEKSATNIMLIHLDSTKYYRIKSGLFGSKDTVTLRKDYALKKQKTTVNQLTTTKSTVTSFLTENSISNTILFEFIHYPEYYDYRCEGVTYNNQNEFVYVLQFKPKKNKAKYVGKLYIKESDFAVIRADYRLDEGKKVSGFNMKFLLGIKSFENVSTGSVTYKQNPFGNGYYMNYASHEKGQYIYLNRPLKFIELTNDEKDVVAFHLKIEGNSFEKEEYLTMNREESSENEIENMAEENFKFITIKSYDPKLWKDYSAIEPLEEMKQFRSVD